MVKRRIVFSLIAIVWSMAAWAQQEIKGTVSNKQGPLPGVSVRIEGSRVSTVTDDNGSYAIRIPSSKTVLVFSSVGYVSQQTQVGQRKNINVFLLEDMSALDEVVVIGYGEVKREDLTGSVASVNVTDLQKAPVRSFEEALAGRVAGVRVVSSDGQPGEPLNIVVRGVSSLTQETAPLYVIDGFPMEDFENNLIDPSDIVSIEVLKDASATAIYGSRGGNGVIIITTKQGEVGQPKIAYQGYAGIQNDIKRQEMMSPYEFVKLRQELQPNSRQYVDESEGRTLESYRDRVGIDWQDEVLQTGQVQNHSLSLSGGNNNTKYFVSGSYNDQKGVIINSGFKRYQGRIVLDQTINNNLKVGVRLNMASTKRHGVIANYNSGDVSSTVNLMYSVWGYRPVSGGTLEDDEALWEEGIDEEVSSNSETRFNPVYSVKNEYNPITNNTLTSNAYLEYKFLKKFTLKITGGLTKAWIRAETFNNNDTRLGNINTVQGRVQGMNGSIYATEVLNLLNENTLTYSTRFNKDHSINVLGGFTMQKRDSFRYGFSSIWVPNADLGISGLDEGIPNTNASTVTLNGLASFLGRATYNYKGRYYLTTSFRADGSSKFAPGSRWAYFPSGSLAWRISKEPFFNHDALNFINDAKLRIGYGATGNNRVADFAYRNVLTVSSYGYGFNNTYAPSTFPRTLGNNLVQWETSRMWNAGIDLSFLKGKIEAIVDVFDKRTDNLLFNASLNPSAGYITGIKNVGEISNSGLELTLRTTNIKTKNFSWQSDFNISFLKNRVRSLNDDQDVLLTNARWSYDYRTATPYIAMPGKSVALFYGYISDGVYQYTDFDQLGENAYALKPNISGNGAPTVQPGDIKYKDINGDGLLNSNDMTIIGDPNPVHVGGFSNNFTYKGFDLNVFFQWSYGNELLNANRIEFEGGARANVNQFATYENRWTPENPSDYFYRAGGYGVRGFYSSRYIEDGSYLRLKTIALGYNFTKGFVQRLRVQQVRVYASAQNLITWTNYSGLDPDVSVRPTALTPGFDWSAYPTARTVTFGLNVNF